MLLLLELRLRAGADLDDRDAAGELAHALLELLLVVVGGRLLDLRADLLDATLDLSLVATALDERGVVLVGDDPACTPEILELDRVELAPDFLADDGAAGQDGDIAQHLLAPITEAGRL